MSFYFPNHLKALRGSLSYHALSKVSKLGVGRLRLLEDQGLSSQVARSSLEAIAQALGVSLTQVFPTETEPPPPAEPSNFVKELIQEQTRPLETERWQPGVHQRQIRLLPPSLNDGVWEVAIDAVVANRACFQDLIAAAEERGGWRSLARHSLRVQGDKKFHRTILVFADEETAVEYHRQWADRSYIPDPPTPVMEIIHRHVGEIAPERSPEIAPPKPEIVQENLPPLEVEEEDGPLVLSAELSPKLMDYYMALRELYGRGLQKAILIRGITAMATDFDL